MNWIIRILMSLHESNNSPDQLEEDLQPVTLLLALRLTRICFGTRFVCVGKAEGVPCLLLTDHNVYLRGRMRIRMY